MLYPPLAILYPIAFVTIWKAYHILICMFIVWSKCMCYGRQECTCLAHCHRSYRPAHSSSQLCCWMKENVLRASSLVNTMDYTNVRVNTFKNTNRVSEKTHHRHWTPRLRDSSSKSYQQINWCRLPWHFCCRLMACRFYCLSICQPSIQPIVFFNMQKATLK